MSTPISVEAYRELVLDELQPLPAVQLPVAQCLSTVTASSVSATIAVPVFTNSAMDGFAVHAADLVGATREQPARLTVTGEVPAGAFSEQWVGDGQAVRIMTGAPLPAGADAVVQVELTDQPIGEAPLPAQVEVYSSVPAGANIRVAGEDLSAGDQVLPAGTLLEAAGLAAAAATGHGQLLVHRRPRVAIIATGAELVAPGEPLDRGQIHDSNSILLRGLAVQAGAEVVLATRCSDDAADFDQTLGQALELADVVVTSGGVSAGTHDVVKNSSYADQLRFKTVAMQPGKPQGHAHLTSPAGHRVTLLALPGNPVSVFVSWYNFVAPVLARLSGRDSAAVTRTRDAVAGADWRTPKARRQYIAVAQDETGRVVPVHRLGSGSHLIASLHLADALAVVPAEIDEVRAGDQVAVMSIRSFR